MPRLPDVNDLGSSRPVVQQQGIVRINGQQVGQAVESTGERMANLGFQIQAREDRMNLAKARAKFTQDQINFESQFDQDQDYKTYGQRYQAGINKVKSDASSMISNRKMREAFDLEADVEITRGYDRIAQKAWAKERDSGVASMNEVLTLGRENALRAGDDQTAMNSLRMMNETISAAKDNGYISATQAQQLQQKTAVDYATAKAGMLPPDARIKALKSGKMFDVIPADKKAALIEAAESESMAAEYQAIRLQKLRMQEVGINALNQIDKGMAPSQVDGWSLMDAGQRNGIISYYNKLNSPEDIKTDYNEFLNVVDVYTNPARRKEAEDFDITSVKNVSPRHLEKLIGLRSKFLQGEDTSQEYKLIQDKSAVDSSIERILGKKKSDWNDDKKKVADSFYRVFDREMNTWLQDHPGEKTVPSEIRDKIIDDMSMLSVKSTGWFSDDRSPFKELIEEEGLTPATVDAIAAGVRAAGRPVNAATIWETYQLRKQELKK